MFDDLARTANPGQDDAAHSGVTPPTQDLAF
jgi:hypothetical protein